MPRAVREVTRRGVLTGGAALAALGVMATACSESPPSPQPDEELLGPLEQARRDSALAAAAAVGTPPQITAALLVVAIQRAAHARALSSEIARANGHLLTATFETTESSETDSSTSPPDPAEPPPAVSEVIDALRAAAQSANRMVSTSSGYRAGLLASIAASCTASATVALPPGRPAR